MRSQYAYPLGLACIFAVAVIWAGASVLTQFIYCSLEFNLPLFLTFLCNALFVVYLPICAAFGPSLPWSSGHPRSHGHTLLAIPKEHGEDANGCEPVPKADEEADSVSSGEVAGSGIEAGLDEGTLLNAPPSTPPAGTDDETPIVAAEGFRYGHLETMQVALRICPFWFCSNYFYNQSLSWTSVTSSTVISSTGSIFTFLIGLRYGDEVFSWGASGGVGLAVFGSVMTGLADAHADMSRDAGTCAADATAEDNILTGSLVLGDVFGLLAAAGYGIYCTTIRMKIPSDDSMSIGLVFGYMGLIGTIFLGPFVLFQALHSETVAAHLSWKVVGFLALEGIFNNVVSDWLWAKSVVLTSATVATVGLSLTMPLAFFSDWLFWKSVPSYQSLLGAGSVILGFFLVSYANRRG